MGSLMFGKTLVCVRLVTVVVFLTQVQILSAADLKVPVGVSPAMSSIGIFIAKEKGYFREQGINVIINPFKASGAKMVPYLATGQLLVAGGNINAGMYNAITQDIPIKIVADKGTVSKGHGYLALIVRKDHVSSGRYKSFKDLKGMKMAVTAKGVSQEIVTERFLEKGDLGLSDIRLVTLAYSDMNLALANKSIDATIQIEPFVASAVAEGFAVRVAGDDEVYPDQQSAVIFMSPEFIRKYPKKAQGFVTAYIKGLRDYNRALGKGGNLDKVINIFAKYNKIKDKKVYAKAVPVGLHPDGLVNIESLRQDAQWFYDKGYVRELPNLDKIVDMSYVENAKKILGEFR